MDYAFLEFDLVRLDLYGLDGHVAVHVRGQVELDCRRKAVYVFNGESVVFNEQCNIVVADRFQQFGSTGDFDGDIAWGKRILRVIVIADELDRDMLEFLCVDFLDIHENFRDGIAWCHESRKVVEIQGNGICLACLECVKKHGVRWNIDDSRESVSRSGNCQVVLQELWLLGKQVARCGGEGDVAFDRNVPFDSGVNGNIDKEVLVVQFYIVDSGKVRSDEILGIEMVSFGTEFCILQVDDHGYRLSLRLQANQVKRTAFHGDFYRTWRL